MKKRTNPNRRLQIAYGIGLLVAGAIASGADCGNDGNSTGLPFYNNTTDPTNNSATYVGSAACSACHSNIAHRAESHGHNSALSLIQGAPPTFPSGAPNAGVPETPSGFDWNDIAYVVGGHGKGANYVDGDGYFLTTGLTGTETQWNLLLPANGTMPGMANFESAATEPLPFDYSCFKCHVTGATPQDPSSPQFQDGRPGVAGTWAEAGVRCESCHGPGSKHIPNTDARDMFVDPEGVNTCNQCHSRSSGAAENVIAAADRYILGYQQRSELLASGGHAEFKCTICHDPHASTTYSPEEGIRNQCTACHTEDNMALHEGKVLTRGDYTEVLTCQSCHMPYATRTASTGNVDVIGSAARMGDTRTHIFRIFTEQADVDSMLTEDGSSVLLDDMGRAAVTVDFVCLRCHNGNGAFELSVDSAGDIVGQMHKDFSP